MEIRKVDTTKYIANISETEISEVRSMLIDLSLGDLKGYDTANDNMLFDKIDRKSVV